MNALTRGTFEYSPSDARRTRARSLAAFFAAGATVSTLVLLTARPTRAAGWEQLDVLGIAITVVCAFASAIYLVVNAQRVGARTCHVLTATGTVLIGLCQVFAGVGSPATAYSHLYVWVVLHSAIFFGTRVVAVHIVIATLVHAGALASVGSSTSILPQLVLALGTQLAAAFVVGSLARHLHALADTDPLTGLGNRRFAERLLAEALDRVRLRQDGTLSLATIEIGDLEHVREELGILAVDDLLASSANAWRAQLRATDVLARTGEHTFLVLMEQVGSSTAQLILRRLLRATPAGIEVSVGVAALRRDDTAAALVRRADDAVREARGSTQMVVAD